jgi:transposase
VRLGDGLPPDQLARVLAEVIAPLDFAACYRRYGPRGGVASAPEGLVGLLVYGDASGVFRARKLARAPDASAPCRCLAGNQHPDHETLATCRTTVLAERQDRFVQALLLATAVGVPTLGAISRDGRKRHADASKSKAVR